jgi:hypothetical protein
MRKPEAFYVVGRRGLLLILGGLSWIGVGCSLIFEPRDRFSSAGLGTDTVLQLLDSQLFAYVWIIAGLITLFTGLYRNHDPRRNLDPLGFNTFLTPPLMWTMFFLWSFLANVVTDGREGQPYSLYSFIVWSLMDLFILVIAGWPEAPQYRKDAK